MAVGVRVPVLGESVLEATVGKWLKSEGDAVAVGDPLVELEAEKVAVEVAAEAAGRLERIVHPQGETVHVGDVLGVLGNGATSAAALTETSTQKRPAPGGEGTSSPSSTARDQAPGAENLAPSTQDR